MSSPFNGRALGARGASPQFPQRRALRRKSGGSVPGFFLGGLFGGSPATSSSQSSSNTQFGVIDPTYNKLMDTTLQKGLDLSQKPYEAYTGQGVVGLSQDQQTAFGDVRANQNNYSPFFNQAGASINQADALDPAASGLPYVGQAADMQTGTQAATPFVNQASQTAPGQIGNYMSPYTDAVVNRIADLGNRNLTENVLPGVNDTFTGGDAAQFGRERHADITGRAVRDNQESIMGQQAQALESGYAQAGSLFNQDANRAAGLAGTTGQLAQGDIAQRAGLGSTASNIAAQGVQSNLATGQAATGLGQATQQAGLTDANALTASGSQQQQQAQNEETWKYNQFQEKRNDPYAKAQFGQGISQGWTLPTQTATNASSSSTQTPAQGSPFGQILGAGIGLLGAAGGVPGISQLGSLFGGTAAGSGTQFAQGGMVPSIAAMRKATMPQQPQGAMPTGMPGMPPLPTLAPQRPQGQPNGQMGTPFATGGYVGGFEEGGVIPAKGNSRPRPTLEDQLDAFGKQLSEQPPPYSRGLESPSPFYRGTPPVGRYAEGGEVGFMGMLDRLFGPSYALERAVTAGDMGSPNTVQRYMRDYGPDFGAAPAAKGGLGNRDLMRQLLKAISEQ